MKYQEALAIVAKHQYLLGQEIIEKSTGITYKVDYVTIMSGEGLKVYNSDWLHPLREVYGKYLSDKDCDVFLIVDFTKVNISISYQSFLDNYFAP